jgi:DNA-binding MarR family transcriptional regulator
MNGHGHGHGHGHGGMVAPPIDLAGIDPLSASVLTSFRKAMHLNRQLLMRIAAGKGGHPGRTVVLGMLAGNDGISQKDLAEKMHLARPTVTIMLQKMEHEGLIERWDDVEDQRLTRIRLTDAGHAIAKSVGDAYKTFVDSTIGTLSEKDRAEFVRILDLLNHSTAAALKELEA